MDAKKYLAENPLVDVVHQTSDGTLFYIKSDAINLAKSLEDKTVNTFEQSKKDTVVTDDATVTKVATSKKVAAKATDETVTKVPDTTVVDNVPAKSIAPTEATPEKVPKKTAAKK